MPSKPEVQSTQHRECSMCKRPRVWIGIGVGCRVCLICDAPPPPPGLPPGFMPSTWEINQRRRERGEVV